MKWLGGGAPAVRYWAGTGTQPPLVTDTSFPASRARSRLAGTDEALIRRRFATSAVEMKCLPCPISQSDSSPGLRSTSVMPSRVSKYGHTPWIDDPAGKVATFSTGDYIIPMSPTHAPNPINELAGSESRLCCTVRSVLREFSDREGDPFVEGEPTGMSSFRRLDCCAPWGRSDGSANLELAAVLVQVAPLEAAQLASPQASRYC